ncbi:uncharacterized protein [Solanum lycopersicum]|uniref:uncharacterized protein n=1 Tax=Solanum lycopersicum TaxID=4081 RepID=UPI003749BFC0
MEGDHVWLRVSPVKGVMRFGKKGKLSPRFIGPFEILSRVVEVAYKFVLPPSLSAVHPIFHISMLRKYIPDESHVISLDSVELGPDLTFEEEPIAIFDKQVRKLRTKEVASVKVHWTHRTVGEATWETESYMRARYPQLFEASGPVVRRGNVPMSNEASIRGTIVVACCIAETRGVGAENTAGA